MKRRLRIAWLSLAIFSAMVSLAWAQSPAISLQPAPVHALAGTTAVFAVYPDAHLTYQWTKDNQPIAGATAPILRLANVKDADAGSYAVTVTAGRDQSVSKPATLTVHSTAANPAPPLPVIPDKVFSVTDNGAVADGTTDNTAAFQKTIAAATAAGGGIVQVPPAPKPYLCGPITLASKINFEIDPGAAILMKPYGPAGQPGAYPMGGNAFADFITIRNLSNIAITGGGSIDGQGAAWWTAFRTNGSMPHRPFMIRASGCDHMLLSNVTLTNSPMFHAALSACNNLTCFAVTVRAPATAPNTDGIDPSGSHQLIQFCDISTGDDNIAVKAGSAFCSDLTVADCTFGTGHGMSVGGQSNRGLDGMTVKNCTFTGTTAGLRLKADATQGGITQNITYTDLTMTNVQYPIEFYSYYKQVGNPGAASGGASVTPDRVKAYNATPPNSLASNTIPAWKNITINNLKTTGSTGYSIIWGLALDKYMIENVTLHDVQLTGAGLDIFNATNVQVTGDSKIGKVVTCNSIAILSQPKDVVAASGGDASFSVAAAGGSGVADSPVAIQWTRDGKPIADGPQPDGMLAAGATTGTLKLTGIKSAGQYAATVTCKLDSWDTATRALVPNKTEYTATSQAAALTIR